MSPNYLSVIAKHGMTIDVALQTKPHLEIPRTLPLGFTRFFCFLNLFPPFAASFSRFRSIPDILTSSKRKDHAQHHSRLRQ